VEKSPACTIKLGGGKEKDNYNLPACKGMIKKNDLKNEKRNRRESKELDRNRLASS
jgi:hypothetical protein